METAGMNLTDSRNILANCATIMVGDARIVSTRPQCGAISLIFSSNPHSRTLKWWREGIPESIILAWRNLSGKFCSGNCVLCNPFQHHACFLTLKNFHWDSTKYESPIFCKFPLINIVIEIITFSRDRLCRLEWTFRKKDWLKRYCRTIGFKVARVLFYVGKI